MCVVVYTLMHMECMCVSKIFHGYVTIELWSLNICIGYLNILMTGCGESTSVRLFCVTINVWCVRLFCMTINVWFVGCSVWTIKVWRVVM